MTRLILTALYIGACFTGGWVLVDLITGDSVGPEAFAVGVACVWGCFVGQLLGGVRSVDG